MNSVYEVGRFVRDPEIKYSSSDQKAIAKFTLAVKDMSETDYLDFTAFGKTAEVIERYCKQGRLIAVTGKIKKHSYTNKEGRKVYVTDIYANMIELLSSQEGSNSSDQEPRQEQEPQQEQFEALDEDVPF